MQIGIQQLMLGKTLKNKDKALDVLKSVKDYGFTTIELDGFMIRKMPYIVKLLTDLSGMPTGNSTKFDWLSLIRDSGLSVIAIHEDLGTIESKLDMVINECTSYACKYVVVTGMYQFNYDSLEELDSLIGRLNKAGSLLKEKGISLLYHNHNVEFSRLENGLTSYEYIVQKTNSEFVNFELDGYWATDAGVNVIGLVGKMGDRVKLYHINDRQKKKRGTSITPIVKFDAAEIGAGVMDIDGILSTLKKTACEAVILETHKNWVGNDPLKSAKLSSKRLQMLMAK